MLGAEILVFEGVANGLLSVSTPVTTISSKANLESAAFTLALAGLLGAFFVSDAVLLFTSANAHGVAANNTQIKAYLDLRGKGGLR